MSHGGFKGEWWTDDGLGDLAKLVIISCLAVGVVSALATLITEILLAIGLILAVIFAAGITVLIVVWRRGWRPSLSPMVSWEGVTHITPPPPAKTREVPPPQQFLIVNNNTNYDLRGADPATAAAIIAAHQRAGLPWPQNTTSTEGHTPS